MSLSIIWGDPKIFFNLSFAPFIISALLIGSYLHKKDGSVNVQGRRSILGWSGFLFFLNIFFINYAYQLTDRKHHTPPASIFFALANTFQTFTVDLDYEKVTEGLAKIFNHALGVKLYIGLVFLVAPIVFGGTILTLLASFFPEMKSALLFFFAKWKYNSIYIFSILNEQSLAYAENIMEKSNYNSIVIFCNCNCGTDDYESINLESRALKNGYFCFRQDMASIYLDNRFPWLYNIANWGSKKGWKKAEKLKQLLGRKVYYYFMHQDDLINSDEAVYISTKGISCWIKCDTVEVITFSQNDITKDILEAIWKKEKKPNVRIIPYITNTVYNTLLKHPLFLDIVHQKLDVAIVGDNIWATEVLKTILWYGQLEHIELHLKCFADDEIKLSKEMKSQISDMDKFDICNPNNKNVPYGKVHYYEEEQINVSTAQIWFVCKDSDEDNMNIAYRLSQEANKGTVIFYQINRDSLAEGLKYRHGELSTNGCEMHIFGTLAECYSPENVQGNLMNLAEKMEKSWKNPGDNILNDEYKRRSSLAAALHIPYKLYALGLADKNAVKDLCTSDEFIEQLKVYLKKTEKWNKKTKEKYRVRIAQMEHLRWIAYMRTIRYKEWNEADFNKLENSATLDSKDHAHKLHLALVPYDKLEKVSKLITNKGTPRDFVNETSMVLYDLRDTLLEKKCKQPKDKSAKFKSPEK